MANILIVDDDEIIQKTIRAALIKTGHTVAVTSDAYTALDMIKENEFHLAVIDINLPMGINGFKLTRMLREQPDCQSLPLLMVSTRRSEKDVLKGIEAGVDDYTIKPIDFDIFNAKISALLTKGSHTFIISRIKSVGSLTTKVEMNIVGISEEGVQFISSVPLDTNSKVNLQSPLYKEIGVITPTLRISHCELLDNEDRAYNIKGTFIGMTSGDLQKVRKFINKCRHNQEIAS